MKRHLPAGDYGVELDGRLVAAVERKTLADLASSLTTGKLRFAVADLAALPRAAVVVEDRYSAVFKLRHVRPAVAAHDRADELAARLPLAGDVPPKPPTTAEVRAWARAQGLP